MRQLLLVVAFALGCCALVTAAPTASSFTDLATHKTEKGNCASIVCRVAGLELPLKADPNNPHFQTKIKDYLNTGSASTERMIGRANVYFPVFEHYLAKHDMPSSLKYLAVAESMLVPGARSSASAAGLWQLMPATAREMGLRVDGTVDERLDVFASTEAAVLMLKQLYAYFGDWHLTLAAYNAGPARVRRAIRAAGDYTNYAKVRRFLPRESQQYVASFMAAAYTLNFYEDYGLNPNQQYGDIDGLRTLTVYRNLNFGRLARACEVDYRTLRRLNPQFVRGYVPRSVAGYLLRVPEAKAVAIQTYVWGRENLVELDNESEDLVLAQQFIDELEVNPLVDLLGLRYNALEYYTPPVAMQSVIDNIALAYYDHRDLYASL